MPRRHLATRAPDRETLTLKTREAILASLVSGTMSIVAKDLSAADKRAVAEYLGRATIPDIHAPVSTGLCANATAPLAIRSLDHIGLAGAPISRTHGFSH